MALKDGRRTIKKSFAKFYFLYFYNFEHEDHDICEYVQVDKNFLKVLVFILFSLSSKFFSNKFFHNKKFTIV